MTTITNVIKTFGTSNVTEQASYALSRINEVGLVVNGTELDIAMGMFESETGNISTKVKETLALLLMEAAKIMDVSVTELIAPSGSNKDTLAITAIGLEIINRLRPISSQIGVKVIPLEPASTTYVNRNILA